MSRSETGIYQHGCRPEYGAIWAPPKVTSFPQKHESSEAGPRSRGGGAVWDYHFVR